MATAQVEDNGEREVFHLYTLGDWLDRRVWNVLQMKLRVARRSYEQLLRGHPILLTKMTIGIAFWSFIIYACFGFSVYLMCQFHEQLNPNQP